MPFAQRNGIFFVKYCGLKTAGKGGIFKSQKG